MSVVKNQLMNYDLWEPRERKKKIEKEYQPCSHCGSENTNEIFKTPSTIPRTHCADCGKFLRKGRDPQVTKACEVRDQRINFILDNYDLNQKEEEFLNDRLYERFHTLPQRTWMDRIGMATMGKAFDWTAYEKRSLEA